MSGCLFTKFYGNLRYVWMICFEACVTQVKGLIG